MLEFADIIALLAALAGAATFGLVLFYPIRTNPVDQALRGRQ